MAAITIALASCGFTSRSDEFKCETTSECTGGRVCQDNWCVLPETIGDANVSVPDADLVNDASMTNADAMVSGPDAMPCPAECTSCSGDLCIIECNDTNECFAGVTCPAGMRCEVTCSGASSCNGDVDCTQATSCDITCSSSQTCQNAVRCGDGPCTIVCSGEDSCAGAVNCDNACSCTTDCGGTNACGNGNPNCPGPGGTCRMGGECVLEPAAECNTCP